MSSLTEVTQSGQPWAAERAQYALQVQQAVASGQMSKDEAAEVLQDIVNSEDLQNVAGQDELKAALVEGLTQLISMYA
jgi:polyhydroxyalkanoate synthesis regulator phasin